MAWGKGGGPGRTPIVSGGWKAARARDAPGQELFERAVKSQYSVLLLIRHHTHISLHVGTLAVILHPY